MLLAKVIKRFDAVIADLKQKVFHHSSQGRRSQGLPLGLTGQPVLGGNQPRPGQMVVSHRG
jgi:hypothetical protein